MNTDPILLICVCVSALSFIFYGWGCLYSPRIKLEFRRYKLDRYRQLVGGLQLTGSVGLILGLWSPLVGTMAAMGLATLMAMGVWVRICLRDTIFQSLPAAFYLVLNAYLVAVFMQA